MESLGAQEPHLKLAIDLRCGLQLQVFTWNSTKVWWPATFSFGKPMRLHAGEGTESGIAGHIRVAPGRQ